MPPPGHQSIDMEPGPKLYDSSGPFFSLYSEVAGKEDNKMTERWQHDATEGILVFSGLFSAAVSVLLAVSIPDLRPNPQDTSAFYLANIYQIFADPNFTLPRTSIPSTIATPIPFSPPTSAVWVNSLWFLSLVISLSCALLAMSLRQWARRFIELTRRKGCPPEERARTRAFFSRGIKETHVPWAVEALPAMLHLSFFLFFSGLLVFLFNINHNTFISVASCIGVFAFLYGLITFLPIFRPDSLYYGPLSPVAWLLYAALRSALFRLHTALRLSLCQPKTALRSTLLQFQAALQPALLQLRAALQSPLIRLVFFIAYGSPKDPRNLPRSLAWRYGYWMSTGLWKVADEVVARDGSCTFDVEILQQTMEHTLGEDEKLERFFEAIPGLLRSEQSDIAVNDLAKLNRFWKALDEFLRRTLWSDSVVESVKTSRLDTYLTIIGERSNVENKPELILRTLRALLRGNFGHLPQTIKRTNILARWCIHHDAEIALAARCVVARLIRSSQTHNRLWVACARDQLDIPNHILCNIIERDEHTISLAILVQMTRRIWHLQPWNHEVLSALSDFHVHKASPRLKNEFCDLWNQIVEAAKNQVDDDDDPVYILHAIRHLYIDLHQDTKAAPSVFDANTRDAHPILFRSSSYPSCDIDHHRISTAHHASSRDPHLIPLEPPSYPFCNIHPHQNTTTLPSTKLDNNPDAVSPRSSRIESHPMAGGSTAQHQHEGVTNVVPSAAHPQAPPHSRGLLSASPTTDLVHVPLQIVDPSIRESIQMIAQDLIRLVSTEVSHPPSSHAGEFPDTLSPITATKIPQTNPNAGVTPLASEESTHVPPTAVSESLSSPVMMPALHSGVILIVLPVRPDRVSHAFGPPSSSITTAGLPSPPLDREHDWNGL